MADEFDVLIIGAGLSGIGAAFHVQNQTPWLTYAILEGRSAIGGTWDLFRYPGVRSDSDMYTLGYSFRPWKEAKAIADGASILKYIKETAQEFGINSQIRLEHRVLSADWSSEQARWSVTVQTPQKEQTFHCRFLILCCGYYDYDQGYTPAFEGLAQFQGHFIHPQKWEEGTDYRNKRIVIIGSGATSVTLLPELAKTAQQVTLLQRSPSYLVSLPSVDQSAEFLKKVLPSALAHAVIRWKNIGMGLWFFRFCRRFPETAKKLLLRGVRQAFPEGDLKNFNPPYRPWDQRVCFVPDGDFFNALRSGKAQIVTDTIERFTEQGLKLDSGKELPADIVVCATGLTLKFLGGLIIRLDGNLINLAQTVPYKGAMLSGIPNLGMAFGYTNASWTLKCDLVCDWLAKIIRTMDQHRYAVVIPEAQPDVERVPMVDFSSGYFQRAQGVLPSQGNRYPWKLNQSYFADLLAFRAKPLKDEGLRFFRAGLKDSGGG